MLSVMETVIRAENADDVLAIREVNEAAFGRPGEALVVETVRASGEPIISLVSQVEEPAVGPHLVGHILFSPVTVTSQEDTWTAMALGPMAVRPAYQDKGIGSLLVREGLAACRAQGHDVVFVLGHPWFYPKFGFRPTRPLGIGWENDVPEEVFMVAELRPGALAGRKGVVRYHPAFDDV